MEKKLQTEIIKWLRTNNVYVIKTAPGGGTPVGCPDIIGLYQDKWLAIEVKASDRSPYRPLQQATLQRLVTGNELVFVACPENWGLIKTHLQKYFF